MSFLGKTLKIPIHFHQQSLMAQLLWIAIALSLGMGAAVLPLKSAGLMIVGGALLLAIIIEPLFGLTLTLLLGPFGALERILGQTFLDSGQLLLVVTIISWLVQGISRREPLLKRPITIRGAFRTTFFLLLAFLGISALSLLNAESLTDSIKEIVKWVQIGLVALLAADMAARRGIQWVLIAILPGALTQAFVGIWQFGLRGHGPEHFEILGRFYRAYGTFEQPNPYAGFLGLIFPLALGWGLGIGVSWLENVRRNFKHTDPRQFLKMNGAIAKNVILLGIAAILLVALFMSWSRGAWLGAAAGFAAMLFFLPKQQWKGLIVVFIVLLFVWALLYTGLMPSAITGRLAGLTSFYQLSDARGIDVTPENYAVLERMAHWQTALSMADYHPWIGVGIGNYAAAYSDFDLLNWPYALGHAHNIYLNMLAETGILGIISYLGFWISIFWLTIQVINHSAYPQRGIALGLVGVWTHLTVHHFVDNLYVNNIYLHIGALLGILLFMWLEIEQKRGADTQFVPSGLERKVFHGA